MLASSLPSVDSQLEYLKEEWISGRLQLFPLPETLLNSTRIIVQPRTWKLTRTQNSEDHLWCETCQPGRVYHHSNAAHNLLSTIREPADPVNKKSGLPYNTFITVADYEHRPARASGIQRQQ